MITEALTLATASGFTVTCIYINFVEQPARLPLSSSALLAEWRVSYHRGTAMQLPLAIIAAALAVASFLATRDLRWLFGAGTLLAIAPWTLLAVLPVNRRLSATTPEEAAESVAALVRLWGRRHAVRGALGLSATLLFVWAIG